MFFNYLTTLLLIVVKLISADRHRATINAHNSIISLSSVLSAPLIFSIDALNDLADGDNSKSIVWYKGAIDSKPLISNSVPPTHSYGLSVKSSVPTRSRYQLVNQTKLLIVQTLIGDEGYYTLKTQTNANTSKQYLYHVVLFAQNLSLSIFPSPHQHSTYHAEQQINLTCAISLYADRSYIEQSRTLFSSTWSMIIYNNQPDDNQLLPVSSNSYLYTAYLFNYELDRNDHNQSVSCTLIQQQLQQTAILNVTLKDALNIEYKAYLRGNYYFTRSFNPYSSIEINCEDFDANPKAVYTLIWILHDINQTLLNKTRHGRYHIGNATWQYRGDYICLAENYLNNHQPVHHSFRLNIWFNEHQFKLSSPMKIHALQQSSQATTNQSSTLIILIIVFVVASLFFILSLYYFCLQSK